MQTWIVLLRGINVGGKNILPMAGLKDILQKLGCTEIRSIIQSGNVVFQTPQIQGEILVKKVRAAIKTQHGFEPHVLLLTPAELQAAIEANPFPAALANPATLHFFFLDRPVKSLNVNSLDELKSPSEAYQLDEQVFYLHAPDGLGRSKLAAKTEKLLGVIATARNYRTVEKLWSLVPR